MIAWQTDDSGRYEIIGYDPVGRPLEEERVVRGVRHGFATTYDRLGQVRTRSYPNGRRLSWQFDSAGYPTGIWDDTSSTQHASALEWDASMRIQSWTAGNGFHQSHSFEPGTGRLGEIQIQNGSSPEYDWVFSHRSDDQIQWISDLVDTSRSRASCMTTWIA